MNDTFYIHDAGTGKLVLARLASANRAAADGDEEAAVERVAEAHGMRWGDCSWGGVDSISISL